MIVLFYFSNYLTCTCVHVHVHDYTFLVLKLHVPYVSTISLTYTGIPERTIDCFSSNDTHFICK